MIHTNRIVTVGEQECIIDRPIVLYRGDREVEIEFTLVGNEFMFSEEGNVIKSVNASHGQLVLNTPSGEHMFSELEECHEGKVVFVVTKEMIDELIEVGFYNFQIRLYDSAEMKSRVTIPPVLQGFDIRNPIAAEDETNVSDLGIVDYSRVGKDEWKEDLPTFDWQGNYNKTDWQHHDVIYTNKLNKIEDALYSINANIKESDVVMLNALDNVKKDADAYVKEHMAEVEAEVDEFERELNTGVEKFKVDTNANVEQFKKDTNDAMTTHKNEVSEGLAIRGINIMNPPNNLKPCFCNGTDDDSENLQAIIDYASSKGLKVLLPSKNIKINKTITLSNRSVIEGNFSSAWNSSTGTIVTTDIDNYTPIFIVSSPSVTIKNLKITGNSQSIGIQVIDGAYDINFENIKIRNCDINFDIQDSWTYVLNKCRTEGGRVGFNVLQGTSANFISCVAFQASEYGYYINGLTYTSFLSCGSDGSNTALFLDTANRGLTFTSFGIENSELCGIKAVGDNVCATFTGLNFGKHNDKEINLIDINGSIITITDFKLSSAMSPGGNGKILNVTEGSQVVLINPFLFGNVGDVDKCNIIGGNLSNKVKNVLQVPSINTMSGFTSDLTKNQTEYINYDIATDSTYILSVHSCKSSVSSGGPQSCICLISSTNEISSGIDKSFVIATIASNSVTIDVDTDGRILLTNTSSASSKKYKWTILKIR